ncbi:MAG: family 20 glycosylhydrolase [Pirellulales bacterium]|nr:family 20 glycosylhydrolase [Pirellulales bacterium]
MRESPFCIWGAPAVFVAAILVASPLLASDDLQWFAESFDGPVDNPLLTLSPQAQSAGGRLVTSAAGQWQRAGLEVGPLVLPAEGRMVVQYAFRPTALGRQGQSFVSQSPSTQQQSLAHASYLAHPQLAHLGESGGVVCSSNPQVFEFLGDLYDELTAAFPYAHAIHVGGDEFGHGFAKCPKCKARADEIGKPGLYAEHMMRLQGMLAQRNRKTMIWRHEEGFTEEAADRLSKDIAIFDWHYGNQRSYPSLEQLQKLGFWNVWATPAVTRYYSRPNDFDTTLGNIRGFLGAAAERKIPGECTCTWCHGIWGGRNMFELNFYALLYSAQCAWNPSAASEDDFRRRLARHWFGLEGENLSEEVIVAWHAPLGTVKEQLFWDDSRDAEPRLAAPPAETIADVEKCPERTEQADKLLELCGRARGVLEPWQKEARRNRSTVDFLLHDVHIYETLGRRILVLARLARQWPEIRRADAEQRRLLLKPIIEDLATLVSDYHEFERMFDRSILEAGGARCGKGSFSGGEIRFRSQDGRQGIEDLLTSLRSLVDAPEVTERPW